MTPRAGVLQRLRLLRNQQIAPFSNARKKQQSGPVKTPRTRSWIPTWSDLRFPLYMFQLALSCHFVANHIGFISATYGPSMVPTIGAKGDWVVISRLNSRGRNVKVGDLVDFDHPLVPKMGAIKRVAGMPGDFVVWDAPAGDGDIVMRLGGQVERIRGGAGAIVDMWGREQEKMMLQIPEGHCWVLGDNQPESRDSRTYGPLPLGLIKGKVTAKIWPLTEAKWMRSNVESISGEL